MSILPTLTNSGDSYKIVSELQTNIMRKLTTLLCAAALAAQFALSAYADTVKAWEEQLTIPTYPLNPAEKSPIFDCDWSYQRARRSVYPYRLNDNMTRVQKDVAYKAVYLENKYVKLCILPEIGGRLFYAIDKTNNYDIFYHQDVIKPANVGMTGAWISGGVEWNVFHHHRATSHMPVNYTIIESPDGSKTVWLGETELRHRMSWAIGVTLHPDKSYIEISGRLANTTMNNNSMLYWSNVSTYVDKNYQIIFPQNTEFGTFHCKESFCHWPVTREAYTGKEEYKNNLDASWWKNHPSNNSVFVHNLKDDFIAGYDHGRKAGTMLVGNHNIVKGGKFWLWGANSGWPTKILTDTAGHYIELMQGAYSDNQPDYTWTYPYEVKSFSQFWYGLRDIGGVKKGSKRAAINMDLLGSGKILVGALATEKIDGAKLELSHKNKKIFEKTVNIAPDAPFVETIANAPDGRESEFRLELKSPDGKTLLSYKPVEKDPNKPLPEIVKPPKAPRDIENTEECFLVGMRNLQFHNPFVNPVDYFEEVLRRDGGDTRANTQMGVYWRLRGDYEKAEKYLRTAIARQTKDYTRPKDCEATYNLGLVLKAQGRTEEAVEMLYRAMWNYAYNSAANFQLAQIYAAAGDFESALERLDEAVLYNGANLPAQNLKSTILRKSGDTKGALAACESVLKIDPVNMYAVREKRLCGQSADFENLMRDDNEAYVELALQYMNNGFDADAESLLKYIDEKKPYPTAKMWLAHFAKKRGDTAGYKKLFGDALAMPQQACNPFRLETISLMEDALADFPESGRLRYWLGCAWYDKQPMRGMEHWGKSLESDPANAMAWRNIGYGFWKYIKDCDKAAKYYLTAISLDNSQAMFFEEIDQVLEGANADVKTRYELLKNNHETCVKRYYPLAAEVSTGTFVGDYGRVLKLLKECYFPTREGVANFHETYLDAVILAGLDKLAKGDAQGAIGLFNEGFKFPENHQVFLYDTRIPRDAQTYCLIGDAYEKAGKPAEAKLNWQKAAAVNTKKTNWRFYKARALQKLGMLPAAFSIFESLIEDGKNGMVSSHVNFYGAEGTTGDSVDGINARMFLTKGFGELGLGMTERAKESFAQALKRKPSMLWAKTMLDSLK